jgi:serine O-acetyltransferase
LRAFEQIAFLWFETKLIAHGRWWRWLSCWFTSGFWIIATYRLSRFFYLLLGEGWSVVRIVIGPLTFLLHPWLGRGEIHYRADIGKGLQIFHSSLGVVISAHAVIGENLMLTGGNCIGGRGSIKPGDINIGNDVILGANAVILGPLQIGNNVLIGAGAVVVRDADDGQVLVGVPAQAVSAAYPAGSAESEERHT